MSKQLTVFLMVAGLLSGCGTAGTAGMTQASSAQLATRGAAYVAPKKDDGGSKPSESKLAHKGDAGEAKPRKEPRVPLPEVRELRQGLDAQDLVTLAAQALSAMNEVGNYESASKIGMAAFKKMHTDGLGNRMLVAGTINAAKAGMYWKDSFWVLTLSLDVVRREVDPEQAIFELATDMMDQPGYYDSGSKIGFAMLEAVKTGHSSEAIRSLAAASYAQARSEKNWKDVFYTLKDGFSAMKKQMNTAK